MVFIFFELGLDGGVVGAGLQGEEILRDSDLLGADFAGLVEVPLVGGAGLHEDGFGVFAVTEDGDHGDEDGEHGDDERDVLHAGFAGFFHLF